MDNNPALNAAQHRLRTWTRRLSQFNAANALDGYGTLGIYSPLEVIGDEASVL